MKNRAITAIVGVLAVIGTTILNYTGEAIILENGTILESNEMPRHVSKAYKTRPLNLTDSLFITEHHTAGHKLQTLPSIAEDQVSRGFATFAYHFAIFPDGQIAAANDLEKIAWHDSGENTNSIGVVFVGNYQTDTLNTAQIKAFSNLTAALCKVLPIKGIRAHRDTSPTLCPGINAYNQTKQLFF